MIWEGLGEDLITLELEASGEEDVFRKMGSIFVQKGFCKESYVDALIEREKNYPTGINMGEIGIAMPHTDRIHVNTEGVQVGILKKPVHFVQMGTDDEDVEVRIVFMLAVKDPNAHIDFLQRIIYVLQDQAVLGKLLEVKEKKDVIEILKEKEAQLDLESA